MGERGCMEFLQWALPQLRLRWRGFRRVHGQVCKRLARRVRELALADLGAYRAYLEAHEPEWHVLDTLCRITISRFYRDHGVFEALEHVVLPRLAARARSGGDPLLRCWSLGCASGEEPYTLAIVWRFRLAPRFPSVRLHVLATDVDDHLLERARAGCYDPGTLKELPAELRGAAFTPAGEQLCVRPELADAIEFRRHDIRSGMPDDVFDLILCRNLVFTYFDEALQRQMLSQLVAHLAPDGALVLGRHETVPENVLVPLAPSIYVAPTRND